MEPGTEATLNKHADGCFPGSQTRALTKLDRKGHAGHDQACSGPGDFPGLRHAAPRLGGSAAGEPARPFPAKGRAGVPRVQPPPQGSAGQEVAVQKGPRHRVIQPQTSASSSVKWGVNRDPTGFLEHTCSVASAEPSSIRQVLHKCSSPRFRQTLKARVLSWGQVKNKQMCPHLDNVPHLIS